MKRVACSAVAFALVSAASARAQDHIGSLAAGLLPDPPDACENCAAWNEAIPPFRIYGNTYYVGPKGLSVILIVSDDGLILLDGALPQSAPLVSANLETLGFHLAEVRLIANSHAHHDHTGGIHALARASGARVAASPRGAEALELGRPTDDDPQAGSEGFPAVSNVRVVDDGEILHVGDVAITAHLTPGHTPGSTTWTWRSCELNRCLDIVYADSVTAVSSDGFRFAGDAEHPSRVDGFRASLAKIAALPCDVQLSPHPWAFQMSAKIAARLADPTTNPFIVPGACAAYAAAGLAGLERRVVQETRGQ